MIPNTILSLFPTRVIVFVCFEPRCRRRAAVASISMIMEVQTLKWRAVYAPAGTTGCHWISSQYL